MPRRSESDRESIGSTAATDPAACSRDCMRAGLGSLVLGRRTRVRWDWPWLAEIVISRVHMGR